MNPTTHTESPLASLAKKNDIVIVADADHRDEAIRDGLTRNLEAMRKAGVKHLFLEGDPAEQPMKQIKAFPSSYNRLVTEAERLGMQVHFYDDKSPMRALDAKYPVESAQVAKQDYYRQNWQALINHAADPQKMVAYLTEKSNTNGFLDIRNKKMTENITKEMNAHPGEKAVVMLGIAHLRMGQDVDEGLRAKGYRVVTAEMISAKTIPASQAIYTTDQADFTIRAETNAVIAYKKPGTETMLKVEALAATANLPWKNNEPVAHLPGEHGGTLHAPAAGTHGNPAPGEAPRR